MCGPVAQLGARFHGMEEVIGSIPIRSTKYFNNLRASPLRLCVTVCVNRDFANFKPHHDTLFLPDPFPSAWPVTFCKARSPAPDCAAPLSLLGELPGASSRPRSSAAGFRNS